MNQVLITGADGLIGRHLAEKLLSEGKEVYGVVSPGSAAREDLRRPVQIHLREMDLNEAEQDVSAFPAGEIDVMYHLAWTGVKPEDRDNFDLQMKNVNMTMNSIALAAALGIRRIVFPGSANSYLYCGQPLDRNATPSPSDAYGAVKIALKYLCGAYARKYDIDFIYTVLSGVYAPDRCDNNVISYTVNKLLRGERPVYTKLEQLWDYIYIDDAVEALSLVGEKGKKNAVYVIGHGNRWELRRYIEIIHHAIDGSLPLGIGELPYKGDRKPGICVDLTDLQRDTGFVPRISFEDGIARVIEKARSELESSRQ